MNIFDILVLREGICRMNILYCGDKNIEKGLIISVISLLQNCIEQLNIYVLTIDIDEGCINYKPVSSEVISYLNQEVKLYNPLNSIELINITKQFKLCMPLANMHTRFTPCCMLRLYADLIDELPDKILYLDNDVICREDIYEFYSRDISECELIGVLDYYGSWLFRNDLLRRDYINSGVLLMNLDKIRETGLFDKCRKLCRDKKMFMPDQSSINKLSVYKQFADRRYNEQRKLHSNTVMQHFTTSFRLFPWIHMVRVKPWQIDKMHEVLQLHEYDNILEEYRRFIDKIEN